MSIAPMIRWSRIATWVFAMAAFMAMKGPGQDAGGTKMPGTDVVISVDVNRVPLYVTVRASDSEVIGNLSSDNFTVKEDGRLQQIVDFRREDLPVAIGLIIDNSQSMAKKRKHVIVAATAFIRASNPQDQMFVIHFADSILFGLNKPFSGDPKELDKALQHLTPKGTTALYDAIDVGLSHLKGSSLTKKALVVISDGGDNSSIKRLGDVAKEANQSGAILYAIGVYDPEDADADPAALRRLAGETGGEAFFPQDLSEISSICESIAHDLRTQYLLVYAPPTHHKKGTYHRVQVLVHDGNRPGLSVTTRNGYFDASE